MTWVRRRWAVVAGLALLLAGALTTASLAALGGQSGSRAALAQTQPEEEDAGVHGGPKPRFHDAGACPLPAGAKLQGNWTHGDYVTAWEQANPAKVRDAAHSACGKPAHVAQRGAKQGKPAKPAKNAGRPGKVPAPEPQPPRSS